MQEVAVLLDAIRAEARLDVLAVAVILALPLLRAWGRISFAGMGRDPAEPLCSPLPDTALDWLPLAWFLRFVLFLAGALGVVASLYLTCLWLVSRFL